MRNRMAVVNWFACVTFKRTLFEIIATMGQNFQFVDVGLDKFALSSFFKQTDSGKEIRNRQLWDSTGQRKLEKKRRANASLTQVPW